MQDNAPAHTSVKQFLDKKRIPVHNNPPYSPNVALCDFFISLNILSLFQK